MIAIHMNAKYNIDSRVPTISIESVIYIFFLTIVDIVLLTEQKYCKIILIPISSTVRVSFPLLRFYS